jgi:hypothetical protein
MAVFADEHGWLLSLFPRWGWKPSYHRSTTPGVSMRALERSHLPQLQQANSRLPLPPLSGPWPECVWGRGGDSLCPHGTVDRIRHRERDWSCRWEDGTRSSHFPMWVQPHCHRQHADRSLPDPQSEGARVTVAPQGRVRHCEPALQCLLGTNGQVHELVVQPAAQHQ